MDIKFQYSDQIVNKLMEISTIKESISNYRLNPSQNRLLKDKSIITSAYNSSSIEGNPLDLKQVQDIFNLKNENKINNKNLNRAEIEVLNYLNTVKNLDKCKKLNEETVLKIHKNITKGTLKNPDMEGKFRESSVIIANPKKGGLNFVPPSPIKVPYQIRELIDWVNIKEDLNPIILAGVFHYEFVRIHPFVDGNGRTARALARLILHLNDFDINGYFSPDEYYNQDRESYYRALQSADSSHDLTQWLEYFSTGFLYSLSRVKEDIVELSHQTK